MDVVSKMVDDAETRRILDLEESHFIDLKGREIAPSKLTRAISAFANTSGGELFIGIEELEGAEGKLREWRGFKDPEAANPIFQVIEKLDPLNSNILAEFFKSEKSDGLVLHLTIFKSIKVALCTDGKAYVRRNAQNLPLSDDGLDRLKFDKGIKSFEDEITEASKDDVDNSEAIIRFLIDAIPSGEPNSWLNKQRLMSEGRPIVAAVLLYSDNPQSILPKRSSV